MDKYNNGTVIDNSLEPRKLFTKQAIRWLILAFDQFKRYPLIWIGITGIYLVMVLLFAQFPLFSFFIMPILNGSLIYTVATADYEGAAPKIKHFFETWKINHYTLRLAIVGSIWGIICLFFTKIALASLLPTINTSTVNIAQLIIHIQQLSATGFAILILLFVLFIWLSIGYGLLPALVLFNHLSPVAAYRFALLACARNWQPIMLYMIVIVCLGVIATLLALLGWIVLFPVLNIAHFYMWKDMFTIQSLRK